MIEYEIFVFLKYFYLIKTLFRFFLFLKTLINTIIEYKPACRQKIINIDKLLLSALGN